MSLITSPTGRRSPVAVKLYPTELSNQTYGNEYALTLQLSCRFSCTKDTYAAAERAAREMLNYELHRDAIGAVLRLRVALHGGNSEEAHRALDELESTLRTLP